MMKDPLEEVQSMAEVPAIAHFCSLFHSLLDLEEFDIEELENALVNYRRRSTIAVAPATTNNGDNGFTERPETTAAAADNACAFLDSLFVKLVRGCVPPHHAKRIHEHNYFTYAKQLFQSKAEEVEEDYGDNKSLLALLKAENPFDTAEEDVEELADLSLPALVRVLRMLTDYRLEAEDIPELVKNMDADSLRVEPVGEDSSGHVFWYFYGTRLYMEVAKKQPKRKTAKEETDKIKGKGKKNSKLEEKKKKKADGGKKTAVISEERVDVEEEEEKEEDDPGPAPGWYLACRTEPDWQRLADRLRASKKKPDRELLSTLETNFLPEIGRMFAQQEREQRLRWLMANKRSSSRIDRRQREQEERQLRDQQLEEQLGNAQLLEEERRRRGGGDEQEKENGPRVRENRSTTKRSGGGGDNEKSSDGGEKPTASGAALAEEREERKRRREAQQDVLRRWQETELDHDYLPAKQRRHFHFY